MPYVSRNGGGLVNGLFTMLQPGTAEEFLADNHADVLAFLAAQVTETDEKYREAARQLLEFAKTPEGRVLRAIVALLVDGSNAELNDLRQWLMGFKAAVAAAGTLAALKTAVAALPNMPDLTMNQAITAIKNKITGNA